MGFNCNAKKEKMQSRGDPDVKTRQDYIYIDKNRTKNPHSLSDKDRTSLYN